MKTRFSVKSSSLAAAITAVLSCTVLADETGSLIKEQPHNIYHVIRHKTLHEAANQLADRSGITFKIDPALNRDEINQKLAADNWNAAIAQLLLGYNYTVESDKGKVKTVVITGRNGSGQNNALTTVAGTELVVVAPDFSKKIPDRYKNFNTGSVFNIKLPLKELSQVPIGDDLVLDLPIGQYKVRHDDFVDHGDGSSTWIGYLDEEGQGYRVYISQGEAGIMGNVYTPDGVYNIESVDGQTVIVNIDKSGLDSAGFEHDQVDPVEAGRMLMNAAVTATPGTTTAANTATAAAPGGPVVDLMVLYTTAKQTPAYARQRIKYLVDISNQAYKDSKINMSLRLVHTRATSYVESNTNSQALFDLASGKGAFAGVAALRNQYGADLVALFRPLYAKTAGSCGTTYVGFANGSGAYPELGYATIGDGYSKDALSRYYCGTSTFTHEIGHNLGNVHDREFSNVAGKFPYSYAWGIDGKFGTIMSYYEPSVMLFSTPALTTQCVGTPCGFPAGNAKASDQSRTINYTAPIVAGFRPKIVTVPVIQ
ncbi:MAG: reprolysin-like metallopeptidase [Methylomonas sp.]